MNTYGASNTCMNMYGASNIHMNIYGAHNTFINNRRASNICMNMYGASNKCTNIYGAFINIIPMLSLLMAFIYKKLDLDTCITAEAQNCTDLNCSP